MGRYPFRSVRFCFDFRVRPGVLSGGSFCRRAFEKILFFRRPKSPLYSQPSRPTKGALRNVINAGRDAVDAGSASDEGIFLRTAKSCGPDTPTLVSSLR